MPADICFVHVDLSVVPESYLEFAKRYPVAVNAELRDIRKSSFSEHLLAANDSWPGGVIVKTDLNYAGWPEMSLKSSLPKKVMLRLLNKMPLLSMGPCTSMDYRVYDSLNDVPDHYFSDDRFVIEKFLPEREREYYVCNSYLFMGESYVCNRKTSLLPIVKDRGLVSETEIEPHPDAVSARSRLKVDYGKFDYCVYEGEMILLDVNKTITFSRPRGRTEVAAEVFNRTNALESFFQFMSEL